MDIIQSLRGIGLLVAAMIAFSILELVIPLRRRSRLNNDHLAPNLVLNALTLALGAALNTAVLLILMWLQARRFGLFNMAATPPWLAVTGSILALDLAWYATHVSMHRIGRLWPIHAVHHSDRVLDVTTTLRQHPTEGLLRYIYLIVFAALCGAPPAGFAIYRIWSALSGLWEHANIRLPQWMDRAICLAFVSPDLHKVHHARDLPLTDSNYGNIFSIWDRMFGTFTSPRHGRDVNYGLAGYDGPQDQTVGGLMIQPFRRRARALSPEPAAA